MSLIAAIPLSARAVTHLWTVVRFGLIGLVVMGVITVPWSLLAVLNLRLSPRVPWAIPITLAYLALVVSYLAGRGGPASTRELRRQYLRARMLPLRASLWSLLAGASAIAALWLVFAAVGGFEVQPAPGSEAALSPTARFAWVVVGAFVTAMGEECGLRGFMQAPLEQRLGPTAAIATTTGVFVLIHAAHGFAALVHYSPFYAAAGVVYGLLAYLTRSIVPSFLLHFLGDIAVFGLRTSLIRFSGLTVGHGIAFCLAAALIAVVVSVAAFKQLTAGSRIT